MSPSVVSDPWLRIPGDGANADEVVAKAATDEAQQEIMKQLSFPEVEQVSKIPQLAPKVSKCLQKRISKLEEFEKKFTGTLNDNQKLKLVNITSKIFQTTNRS